MDDFVGDFDYLNNIRDAQMFQRVKGSRDVSLKDWTLLNIMMKLTQISVHQRRNAER